MNDLELLDLYGPQPLVLHDDVYARAATQLADRIRPVEVIAVAGTRSNPRSTWRVSLAAAAAVVAALGVTILSPFGNDPALAIVKTDPLTFPVTATTMPHDLPLERYMFGPSTKTAMYGKDLSCDSELACTGQQVSIVTGRSLSSWKIPADAATVSVQGHDAVTFASSTIPELSIVWTVDDLVVGVTVTGEGHYRTLAALEEIADGITTSHQQVDLCLTAVPDGWDLKSYLSDQFVAYGDRGQLNVALNRPNLVDLRTVGAHDVRTLVIAGRPAEIGTLDDGNWVLQTTTADGQAFTLQAPNELSQDQVEKIAASVRHNTNPS